MSHINLGANSLIAFSLSTFDYILNIKTDKIYANSNRIRKMSSQR